MQLLNKLPETLHKFFSLLCFQKVVLKAASDSKPFLNLNHLQQRSFLRRSRLQMFFKIGVYISQISQDNATESLFLIKLQALLCNFIKESLQHKRFPVKFLKLLRTPIFHKTLPVAASNFSGNLQIFRRFFTSKITDNISRNFFMKMC